MAIVKLLTVSIIGYLLHDELKAWLPWMTRRLVSLSIRILPEDERERYGEEYPSHLNEIPGEIGKIFTALGFVFAGFCISIEQWKLRGALTSDNALVSDVVLPHENRYSFGLLPEPESSPASFFVSCIINGAILGIMFWLGYTAKLAIH